jgi:hypothetical protein
MSDETSCTAFDGVRLLSSGPLIDVALAVKQAVEAGAAGPLLVFNDKDARIIDLDLRGSAAEIAARLAATQATAPDESGAETGHGRGRPKLGVVGREVTLLPRQWEWLAAQPGGASVTLRKLVEAARRDGAAAETKRQAQEAAYRFMSALGGDLPGYEEATRALFADDRGKLERQMADWPDDVRAYALKLAGAVTP